MGSLACSGLESGANSQSEPTPVNLQIDNSQISVSFVQNGDSIPIVINEKRGAVVLAPASFTIQIDGDKESTSILALADPSLLPPLEGVTQPIVTFAGTGRAFANSNLLVTDDPIELRYGSASFFLDFWAATPEQATELSSYLENKLGTVPLVFFSGHDYLDTEKGITDFAIETINGNRPMNGQQVLIVIFLQSDLGETFSQLEWLVVQVSFGIQ